MGFNSSYKESMSLFQVVRMVGSGPQATISRSDIYMLIHTGNWTNGLRANIHKGHRGYERRSLLLPVFGFTTQMDIAIFSPSPCQEISLCSEVLPKCFGVPWRAHKRLSSFWRKGHISDASSSHISTLLHPSVETSHIALSMRELLALLQRAQVCPSEQPNTSGKNSWQVI